MGILTMLLQFLTPVMYPVSRIAGNKKITPFMLHLYMMNPMANILECYRNILYNRQIPDISTLASAVAFGVLFLVVGECCFMKLQKGFAEEL